MAVICSLDQSYPILASKSRRNMVQLGSTNPVCEMNSLRCPLLVWENYAQKIENLCDSRGKYSDLGIQKNIIFERNSHGGLGI
jgi:hypothetical protein